MCARTMAAHRRCRSTARLPPTLSIAPCYGLHLWRGAVRRGPELREVASARVAPRSRHGPRQPARFSLPPPKEGKTVPRTVFAYPYFLSLPGSPVTLVPTRRVWDIVVIIQLFCALASTWKQPRINGMALWLMGNLLWSILGALVCLNIHGNTWTPALHATRFLTLPLYHLEVGWSFYPFELFFWPIACVYA